MAPREWEPLPPWIWMAGEKQVPGVVQAGDVLLPLWIWTRPGMLVAEGSLLLWLWIHRV